jgi:hypothetical protein
MQRRSLFFCTLGSISLRQCCGRLPARRTPFRLVSCIGRNGCEISCCCIFTSSSSPSSSEFAWRSSSRFMRKQYCIMVIIIIYLNRRIDILGLCRHTSCDTVVLTFEQRMRTDAIYEIHRTNINGCSYMDRCLAAPRFALPFVPSCTSNGRRQGRSDTSRSQ